MENEKKRQEKEAKIQAAKQKEEMNLLMQRKQFTEKERQAEL